MQNRRIGKPVTGKIFWRWWAGLNVGIQVKGIIYLSVNIRGRMEMVNHLERLEE